MTIPHPRWPWLAAAARRLRHAAAPLQGEFTAITPREAVDRDSTGAMVRWGGRIVQIEPQRQPHLLRDDLDHGWTPTAARTGRPTTSAAASSPAAPASTTRRCSRPNREVTFTGRIDGYENRRIGEYDYRFPRVAADVVYLWPVRERVDVITRPGAVAVVGLVVSARDVATTPGRAGRSCHFGVPNRPSGAPGQQVQVDLEHRLPAVAVAVHHDAVAVLGEAFAACA